MHTGTRIQRPQGNAALVAAIGAFVGLAWIGVGPTPDASAGVGADSCFPWTPLAR